VKKEGEDSVALNIAKGAVKIPEEKIQEIVFTMAKDKTKREACRQAAAEEIMKLLDEGKQSRCSRLVILEFTVLMHMFINVC
jgi:precorrin-2 C20-methyltransferase (EC 2.1.1.130)/cobalt-factor II C20-methyltransferase (EC 2.1.1.151)